MGMALLLTAVHRENKKIVGVACAATYAHSSDKGAVVWVRELAVHPDFRRQGIGKRLLLQTLQYGAQHEAVRAFLHVDVQNIAAIHIYESVGFTPQEGEKQIDMIWRADQ